MNPHWDEGRDQLMEPFDELRNLIESVRRRWFTAVALKGLGVAAGAAAVPLAAAAIAVWWTSAEGWMLVVLAAVACAMAAISCAS